MSGWRSLLTVSTLLVVIGASALLWEERSSGTSPAAGASQSDSITVSTLYPGGQPPATLPDSQTNTHEELSGYDISEGKRLYHWYNCNTCHANGGGNIGPALMDDKWLYGASPRNIFASILEGRPNGMPSFRGKIPDAQVWQIVAYVRSMSGKVPIYAPSSRGDEMSSKPAETLAPKEPVNRSGGNAPDPGASTQ